VFKYGVQNFVCKDKFSSIYNSYNIFQHAELPYVENLEQIDKLTLTFVQIY
jgi:hypothetical protein